MNEELKFILKMRDDAQAVLKAHGLGLKDAGRSAGDLANQGKKADQSLQGLMKTAKEAAGAFAGLWASARGVQGANKAWNEYELGLIGVQKTTNMTKAEMVDFGKSFDELNAQMKGIDTSTLAGIAEGAGQMGVRGKKNIIDFTKVMGQLGVTTDIAGKDGATSVSRLLNLTGEGVAGVRAFGDALTYLGNNSQANEGEILQMAQGIAQATAGMHLSTDATLAMAAAAKSIGLPDELTSGGFGRVLRNLSDGAANATEGFQSFLAVTGMTKKQFDELQKTNPEQILLRFSEAYAALQPTGKSAGFLDSLGLNTDEIKRVFGTIGTNVEDFQKQLAALQKNVDLGALDNESAMFFGASANEVEAMGKAWDQIKAKTGEALAPLTGPAIRMFTDLLNAGATAIGEMDKGTKATLASAILLAPALYGAVKAVSLIRLGFKALSGAGGIAGAIAAAKGPMDEAATAAGLSAGEKAGTGFKGKFLSLLKNAALLALVIDAGKTIGSALGEGINATMPDLANKFADWRDSSTIGKGIVAAGNFLGIETPRQAAEKAAAAMKAAKDAAAKANPPAGTQGTGAGAVTGAINTDVVIPGLNTGSGNTIADIVKGLKAQIAAAGALTGRQKDAVELQDQIREAVEQTGVSYAEASRQVGGLVTQLQAVRADSAVSELLRSFDEQIEAAGALTADAKDRLEISKAINDVEREHGQITDKQVAQIESRIKGLQAVRRAAALSETIRDLDMQLLGTQALTRADQGRLSILQKLVQYQLQSGVLTTKDADEVARKMEAIQQAQDWNGLRDQLDPVGAATRQYNDDLTTLKKAFEAGAVSGEAYSMMLERLKRNTEEARDPVGAYIRSQRDEIAVLREYGENQGIASRAMNTLNGFRQQGVKVTEALTAAVYDYEQAMLDADRAGTTGIQGWINSVGTFKDGLEQLKGDAVESFSDALTGTLTGDKGALKDWAQDLGKQMVKLSMDNMIKDLLGMAGLKDPKQSALDRADEALAKIDALSKAGINAPSAVVNAGTVTLSGDIAGLVDLSRALVQQIATPANDNRMGTTVSAAPASAGGGGLGGAVDLAASMMGSHETANRSQVNSFLKKGGVNIDAARTAWCAAFVNSALAQIGVKGDGSLLASDFLNWGSKVDASQVMKGDVLVKSNGRSAGQQGAHVGFATGETRMSNGQQQLQMLSGNSSNKVQTEWINATQLQVRRAQEEMAKLSPALEQVTTASVALPGQLQQAALAIQSLGAATPQGGAAGGLGAVTGGILGAGSQVPQLAYDTGVALGDDGLAGGASTALTAVSKVTPELDGLGSAMTSLLPIIGQMIPGLGGMGGAIGGLLSSLLSGGGGGGMGGGGSIPGLFQIASSLMGSKKGGLLAMASPAAALLSKVFHGGGTDSTRTQMRMVSAGAFTNAPRFHEGFANDEYPAVLQRGERVLTESQNSANLRLIDGLSEQVREMSGVMGMQGRGQRPSSTQNNNATVNVYTRDATGFNKSRGQIASSMGAEFARQSKRNR